MSTTVKDVMTTKVVAVKKDASVKEMAAGCASTGYPPAAHVPTSGPLF
ncbi:MAG TPA: hypothetical protein VFB06_00340 [Streptosporangiaceae bacterium]|nr:hypothetical protein [Streptosporangiaceae bacterium]